MDSIGKICPYCQTPIKTGEEVIICDFCGIVHHRLCWNENRGCTTYGCRGSVANTEHSRPVANPIHNNSANANPVNPFNAQNTPYTVNSANIANNSKSTQILLIIFGVIIGVFITYYFINNSMGTTGDNQENRYSQTQDNHYQTNNDSQSRETTNYNTESSNINEEDNNWYYSSSNSINNDSSNNPDIINGYRTYVNNRFGFTIDFPENYSLLVSNEGSEATFVSSNGNVKIIASGINNKGFSTEELYEQALQDACGIKGYKQLGDTWFVITWNDDGTIFYLKYLVSAGSINRFIMSMPEEQIDYYSGVVTHIEKNFKRGNTDIAH